jgi:hypothetical protein
MRWLRAIRNRKNPQAAARFRSLCRCQVHKVLIDVTLTPCALPGRAREMTMLIIAK